MKRTRPAHGRAAWKALAPALLILSLVSSATDAGAARMPPLVAAPSAVAADMVLQGNAGIITEYPVALTAGVQVRFETVNFSTRSDPVLHLLNPKGLQVAVNDDFGTGNAARIIYTPSTTGTYTLVIRARSSSSGGTTDLLMNGSLWRTGVRFTGLHLFLSGLRFGEVVETVRVPNGGGPVHLLYFLASDGLSIASRAYGGGTSGGALRTITSSLAGSRYVVIGIPKLKTSTTGPVRLIRNDFALSGHDPDDDGLGSDAETDLGTCSALSGFPGDPEFDCSLATDPRDTDGDGISDRWEVVGRRDLTPHQPLPLWGADPRHKDLFIEVDFMRRSAQENIDRVDATMPDSVARKWADVFGDVSTTDPLLALYNARILVNPDAEPGIDTHIDTGHSSSDPADAARFGDWGGHNAVNAVCAGNPCTEPCNTAGENCMGATADNSWMANMTPARRGIFRYHLAYQGGGGQEGPGFTASYNMDSDVNSIHETGHTFYLGHSGPSGGAQLGVNCKPNYPSIMSYSYYETNVGFSNGLGRPGINNAGVEEWGAVNPSNTQYLDDLTTRFKYHVDGTAGHVDWNRDGVFAPDGTLVRSYANFRPGADCEHTRFHQNRVLASASHTTPAVARLGNRTYVFSAIWPGILRYAWSTSAWNCPRPDDAVCGSWADWDNAPLYTDTMRGIDAVRIRYGKVPQDRILVVAVDHLGRVWETRLTLNSSGVESWSPPVLVPGSTTATSQPALTARGGIASLVYRGPDGALRFNQTTFTGAWGTDRPVISNLRFPLYIPDYTSPGIVWAALGGGMGLYGAFAGSDGRLDLWYRDPFDGFWYKTDRMEGRPGPIESRPALQWVPDRTTSEAPGRLYLVYVDPHSGAPDERELRMRMSYVKVDPVTGAKTTLLGLDSSFDNTWLYGYGIDLLYDAGVDTNLRAAFTVGADYGGDNPDAPKEFQVWYRPVADGIFDYRYTNHNDWQVLRVGICRNVVDPAGVIPDAEEIQCPPKDW